MKYWHLYHLYISQDLYISLRDLFIDENYFINENKQIMNKQTTMKIVLN